MISKKNVCGNFHRMCNYDDLTNTCKSSETCGQNCNCEPGNKPPNYQSFSYVSKGEQCDLMQVPPGKRNNVLYHPTVEQCKEQNQKPLVMPKAMKPMDNGVGIR